MSRWDFDVLWNQFVLSWGLIGSTNYTREEAS